MSGEQELLVNNWPYLGGGIAGVCWGFRKAFEWLGKRVLFDADLTVRIRTKSHEKEKEPA